MKFTINIEKKHLLIITLILVISTITFVLAQTHGVSHHADEITAGEFARERIPTTLRGTTIQGD